MKCRLITISAVIKAVPVENFGRVTSYLPADIQDMLISDKIIQSEKSDNTHYVK
jgi:hypothetical protein